ncbi:MAG: lamin tail domain-containing protein, partial [Anaerolineales bacterium]|nr:lamin tail domain-containing protein [Anaerolineales bacterium]
MCHTRFKRKLLASCGLAACVLLLLFGASGTWSAAETRLHLPAIFENWAPPTPSSTDPLLITELLVDAALEPGGEWFELYNPNPGPLDLTYYKVGDEETFGGGEGMFQFPFGSQLRPRQVLVVAHQATSFQATYGFLPDYELRESLPQVPNMIKYAAWATGSVELVNSGDDLLVLNSLDAPVDAVSWGSSLYAFSPSAPKAGQDQTLARHSVCLDSDTASDWLVRAEPSPGWVEACPL